MSKMKIVAGMGNTEDYPDYVYAGADEVFVGYVPHDFYGTHGRFAPINRREVIFVNVSLGGKSELSILADMKAKLGVKCTIAVNAPVYTPFQRTDLCQYVRKLSGLGFKDIIVADEELMGLLTDEDISIHVSGEYGELNRYVLRHLNQYRPKRIIFPRQTTISEMKSMIASGQSNACEYEAFVLNEKCHFTGAYCSSRHCDELCHMCRVPYEASGFCISEDKAAPEVSGASGCGICALWDLKRAGITHVKLVSRGQESEKTIQDIRMLKRALDICDEAQDRSEYIQRVKSELFPKGCSENCYYEECRQ